jgi:hypothetical protein
MNIDKEREAFNEYSDRLCLNGIRRDDAWIIWQARASLMPTVEQIAEELLRQTVALCIDKEKGQLDCIKIEDASKAIRKLMEDAK